MPLKVFRNVRLRKCYRVHFTREKEDLKTVQKLSLKIQLIIKLEFECLALEVTMTSFKFKATSTRKMW